MIAVSLNVGGGVRPYLIGKTEHMHAKTLQTQRRRTHDAGYARPWFRTTEPLGESRYENWLTTTSHFLELCGHDGQASVQASFAVW